MMKTWFVLDEKCTEYVDDVVSMMMYVHAQQELINASARFNEATYTVTMSYVYKLFGVPIITTMEEDLCGFIIDGINTFIFFDTAIYDKASNGKKYVIVNVGIIKN